MHSIKYALMCIHLHACVHTCHVYTHVTYTHMSHIHMELYFVFYFRLGALFFMVAIMGIINIPAIDTFMKERPIFV